MQEASLSTKQEIKQTLLLSLPLVISQMVYASSSFFSTMMVSSLGKNTLAATVIVNMLWTLLSVFFFGMLNSICSLVAHHYSAKDSLAVGRIMGQGFILSLFISVVLILLLFSIPSMLHLSHQPPHVLNIAMQYNYSLIWMIPALILLITYEQFFAGINKTKLVLRISLFVVPLEIILIYILMFGVHHYPGFGVSGIGYGFAISYTITAILITLYLLVKKHFRPYHLFQNILKPDWVILKKLIHIGYPTGLVQIIEVSAFSVVTFWIGHFGTTLLAAHQIAIQYFIFIITLVFSMSQAVMIRVTHFMSQKNYQHLYTAAFVGLLLNGIVMFCIALAFYFMPAFFIGIDLNHHNPAHTELIQEASTLLRIVGLILFIDNFRIIGMGALRGLKDFHFPFFITLFSFGGVACPAAYYLGFHCGYGAVGIWWGLFCGVFVGALLTQYRLQLKLKQLSF